MNRALAVLMIGLLLALAGACSDDGEGAKDGAVNQDSSVKQDGGKADLPTPDTGTVDLPVPDAGSNKAVGDPCGADAECKSGVCHKSKCVKTCTSPKDCTSSQDCGEKALGKPAFCYDRKYGSEAGKSCAATYKCSTSGMKCYYSYLSTSTPYCSPSCTDNTDCPPQFYCRGTTSKICSQRRFCTACHHDGQCPTGYKCITSGGAKFCSRSCTKGGGECPRFADCKDVGGKYQCVHKSGKCTVSKGAGKLCDPCSDNTNCATGGMCITLNASWGYFCGQDCTSKSCPTDNKCYTITGSSYKQCWPDPKKKKGCVTLASSMDAGDIMDDFAMVGVVDSNKDGSLAKETRKEVKLSDFATSHKIILFVISAGWCGPCKVETKSFVGWMKTYGPKGLMIYQTLSDGATTGKTPDPTFLTSWITGYNPMGACGIDPKKLSSQYNTKGTIPMNMILDAKTLKVLEKWNGGSASVTEAKIKKYLGITTDAGVPAKDSGAKDSGAKDAGAAKDAGPAKE